MKIIKVEVFNQSSEMVYSNEGAESLYKEKFDEEIEKYNTDQYEIVWSDATNEHINSKRKCEYAKQGLSFDSFVEMLIEDDTVGLAQFRSKRDLIKADHPKPL